MVGSVLCEEEQESKNNLFTTSSFPGKVWDKEFQFYSEHMHKMVSTSNMRGLSNS